eukprot:5084352-Prymnesium_polylepis.2
MRWEGAPIPVVRVVEEGAGGRRGEPQAGGARLGALRADGGDLEVGERGEARLPAVGEHDRIAILDEAALLGHTERKRKALLDVRGLSWLRMLRRTAATHHSVGLWRGPQRGHGGASAACVVGRGVASGLHAAPTCASRQSTRMGQRGRYLEMRRADVPVVVSVMIRLACAAGVATRRGLRT